MAYKYFIASFFIALTTTNAQDNSNCYNKGAYVGLINDLTQQESADSCANYCTSQSYLLCQCFTFDPATNLCETFSTRETSLDTVFCPNCISGYRNHFCGAQGFCKVIKNTRILCFVSNDGRRSFTFSGISNFMY